MDLRLDLKVDVEHEVMGALEQLQMVGSLCGSVRSLTLRCLYPDKVADSEADHDSDASAASPDAGTSSPSHTYGGTASSCTQASSSASYSSASHSFTSASSSSGTSALAFGHLLCLTVDTAVDWAESQYGQLADMLLAAPLQYLSIHDDAPPSHQLSTLTHLRALKLTDFNGDRFDLPPEHTVYFQQPHYDSMTRSSVRWEEVTHAIQAQHQDIGDEEVDKQLADAMQQGTPLEQFADCMFITEQRFDGGLDGREALFAAVAVQANQC